MTDHMPRHIRKKTLNTMTLPRNTSSNDMDVNSLMNNREFQEILQDYFQDNTMTLDEFMDNLPRFMMETYGPEQDEEVDEESVYSEEEEDDAMEVEYGEDAFMAFLRRGGHDGFVRTEPVDPSSILLRSLLAGRREIPLRNIVPQSPPPSPVPNIVNTAASIPFFQRNGLAPPVPSRPNALRRVPSQLRSYTSHTTGNIRFDPNAPEECKSPYNSPVDRNNELPVTGEYMRRYGHERISMAHNDLPALIDDPPER